MMVEPTALSHRSCSVSSERFFDRRASGVTGNLYNLAWINSAIRMSEAMAIGLEQRLWDIGRYLKLIKAAKAE
jgi:hypothetical protein